MLNIKNISKNNTDREPKKIGKKLTGSATLHFKTLQLMNLSAFI